MGKIIQIIKWDEDVLALDDNGKLWLGIVDKEKKWTWTKIDLNTEG